ncbi:hypothetical protein SAMN04489713_103266 [Actinomadura madurae]|uniref:Uncharacterized protein n=1 Tax=Actinomadura madurae TaxID=1993 RepID=A0A1I5CHU2_9ACTN|nr:hypothetical protein SAMN04489713_103266 [Actinomadura madurae]SPT50696.1 Uncharacterised protein [Actinomadura madurae]
MSKFPFLLPSEGVRTGPAVGATSPGLRRVRAELARHGSLGRSFDNKCAHDRTSADLEFANRVPAS